METLAAGGRTTIGLPTGQQLTLTVSADATGSVVRLPTTPGGGDAQSVTQIAGATLTFGAYAQPERFEIRCTVGSVAGALAIPNPADVSFDDEVAALLADKAPLASPTFTGTTTIPTLDGGSGTFDDLTPTILKLPTKTPVNAVAANGVVTFTGTPLVYVANVFATGTITVTGTPIADETLTVDAQVFTFKATRAIAGEITIDANNTTQAANIVTAITADLATVTAANVDGVATITSVAAGTAGNSIVLSEVATGVAVSGAGTLANGVDEVEETVTIGTDVYTFVTTRSVAFEVTVSANNTTQGDNLVTAITADDTAGVTAVNSSGAVTVTAATKGVIGNGSIALSESATGTAVSGVTGGQLDGGIDGTVGTALELAADSTYLYYCVAANTISGTNWRRVSLGSAY